LQKAEIAYAPDPVYPPQIGQGGKGKVDLICDIDPGGTPEACRISQVTGNPAFGPAALAAARHAHYLPAWRHGGPVAEPGHHITLYFTPPAVFPGQPGPAQNPSPAQGYRLINTTPVYYRGGPHYPSEAAYHKREGAVLTACTIATDGTVHHCRALARTGSASFAFYALAYVRHQTFRLTRDGKPASATHYEIVQFTLDKNKW
jgi:TonB family protein